MKIVVTLNSDPGNTPFTDHLEQNARLHHVAPSFDALQKVISAEKIDAIIGEDANLELIKKLIMKFPGWKMPKSCWKHFKALLERPRETKMQEIHYDYKRCQRKGRHR
ncbi:MAG: hypothetical protein ABR512_05250 [Desulfopila sp.]